MPRLPCWDTQYPSTKPSCIYRTNNTGIMTNTYCHHTQAPQTWSESQKNLTDFTCFGHKKIKLRNAAFSYLLTCDKENFQWLHSPSMLQLSLLVIQPFILWATKHFTNQGHSSRMKETPNLMYLFWLRVLAAALSSIRFKLHRHSTNEPDSHQFFSPGSVWWLRLGALLISLQYPILSD